MSSLSSDSALQIPSLQGIALRGLALDAELAGAAMACRYSSSDEYEAALIAERRRAGAYDVPSGHRTLLWVAMAVSVAAAVLLAF